MEKYIAFIGDSYCATYKSLPANIPYNSNRVVMSSKVCYPNVVAEHFNYKIAPYGFGGKSWWYSWHKFEQDWEDKLDQLEAIVFCHTSIHRINTATLDDFPCLAVWDGRSHPQEMTDANKYYFKYIYDVNFHMWAQQQYFKMLKEKFDHIKTIHFHCFGQSIAFAELLPGCVYTTPLTDISFGEVTGSPEEVSKSVYASKANHFNDHNNQAFANLIIGSLEKYEPGQHQIKMKEFDCPNPNAVNWPDGHFWTD